jgi:protein disulfide-isomerase-like protein
MMMMKVFSHAAVAALLLPTATQAGGAQELSLDTFDSIRAGRNAFVKFFAPWCGHCKSMKAAWDQLGDEFAGPSSSVLIGDADCTADAKSLCEKYGVTGYPAVKYFVNGETTGTDYKGPRDFESLLQHTRDVLEIKCDVKNPSECSEREKMFIEKMTKASAEERTKQLNRIKGMLGKAMKADLKQWLNQRFHILKSMAEGGSEEL